MDASALATTFGAQLPSWVLSELAAVPETLPTDEDRVRLANRLAERNHREDTGGPFAALVVETTTGRLVSAGVNLVLTSGLSSTHAEVVALSLAQTRLGAWDLGAPGGPDLELVVNWRPCAMCYGAAMWSGVRRLLIARRRPRSRAPHRLRRRPHARGLGPAVRTARHPGRHRRTPRRGRRSLPSLRRTRRRRRLQRTRSRDHLLARSNSACAGPGGTAIATRPSQWVRPRLLWQAVNVRVAPVSDRQPQPGSHPLYGAPPPPVLSPFTAASQNQLRPNAYSFCCWQELRMTHGHGHDHGHDHGHHHHHHGEDGDAGSLPPALDLSVPDQELTPSQLSRRSMLRRTGLLGAGLAAGSVLAGAGQAAAASASAALTAGGSRGGGLLWLAG